MKGNVQFKTITTAIILTFICSLMVGAQERRIRPAFPIAPGEKMLVIPGQVFDNNGDAPAYSWISRSEMEIQYYKIILPVGTVLKRMIAEVVDHDGDDSQGVVIDLYRIYNSAGLGHETRINIRTIRTSTSNSDELVQLVSYPMNHAMKQSWSYYVSVGFYGKTAYNYKIGVIKIIYEP